MATKIKLSTGNIGYVWSTYTTSKTDTTATITVTAHAYLTDGWVQSTGIVAKITINGETSTQTLLGNGTYYAASSGTKTKSYSVTVNKGTSAKDVSWSVQFWQATDGTLQTKKHTGSGTVSVAAKTSYKVTFNANGGTGAPSTQTKWHGTALKLSTTKPTKTGHTFLGWATSSSATAANGSYDPGDTYSTNAALALYAVWKINTWTVKFDANGGTGGPTSQTKTYGTALTLSSSTPTKTGYTFLGWGTSATATAAAYQPGDKYSTNAAITLYAVWQVSYWNPKITGLKAQRCTSDGELSTFGTYAKVSFNWSVCTETGSNSISALSVACNGSTASISASGDSGSASVIVGAGALSLDGTYSVTISATDALGGSSSVSKEVTTAKFPIDFLAGGLGTAIGRAATLAGWLDIEFKALVRDTSEVKGDTANTGAFIIGDPEGQHVGFDSNEVQAKAGPTETGWYYVNKDGGNVWIGSADGYGYFPGGIKADKPVELHGMTVTCSAAQTLSTSTAKLTMGTVSASSGSGLLEASNGGIKTLVTGRVLVIGSIYATDMTIGNSLGATIYRESTALAGLAIAQTGSRGFTVVHTQPRIFIANAGQTFYLYGQNGQSATGNVAANARTQLTVLYIN